MFLTLATILFALLGTPLFAVIAFIALYAFHGVGIDSSAIMVEMYRLASAPVLLAIPLFTYTGYVMAESGVPRRMMNLSNAFLGGLPAGLAYVALVSCAFFTAFTGASGVTIIALGGLLYPILLKDGYGKLFSLGLMTSSGSLGLLFPPSLPLILYGLVSNAQVDKLFIAGIVPGTLMILIIGAYSAWKSPREKGADHDTSLSARLAALRASAWELPIPVIIFGGIYGGFTTVTEAAAISAFYVTVAETFIKKDLGLKDIPKIMRESMVLVGGILIILGMAMGLTNFLIDAEIPMKIFAFIREYIDSKLTFLMLLNIFLLIVGCMMDIFSATMVVVPIIVPIAQSFGVDLIHLGIIFLTNMEIGYSTPPVGINLFIAGSRFEEPVASLYRAVLPFIVLRLIGLTFITYVPELSLYPLRLFWGE
ncbi:MAG: TRAP transporter large permease subunit [Nitrospinae bacterium]|nr:TRAP transporter large permease subunit [Nitrospinota bacterium]